MPRATRTSLRQGLWLIPYLLLTALLAPPAQATPGCGAIGRLMDATAPAGPVLLPSYPTATDPALHDTGFVYDNALAVIALLACHDPTRAARIGAALRTAATQDRFWHDGRLRNAYRAGPIVENQPPALPGWWDKSARRWDEDDYQISTATGNVAWAALALTWLGTQADRAAADRLMRWVLRATATTTPVPGFAGGYFGEEPAPLRLAWQSTEQNTDVAAALRALAGDDPRFAQGGDSATSFVAAMWDRKAGRFLVGTDGKHANRAGTAIDATLWPLIAIAPAPADWQRAKAWIRAHCAVAGGFGFHAAPDGIWTEGTAQAALILPDPALLPLVAQQRAPDGLLYATPQRQIGTGFTVGPAKDSPEAQYFHLPHLGATAWAVLAETRTNPFQPPH